MTMKTDITKTIIYYSNKYINRYQYRLMDINDGDCENLAMDVINSLGGESNNLELRWLDELIDDPYLQHCVIVYNNKYYDAEHPKGVLELKDLNYYKRWSTQ